MSNEQDKRTALQDFTQKAAQRIRDKRVLKRGRYHVPSLDQEVVLRGLTTSELQTCVDMDEGKESNRDTMYTVYTAMVEPDLKAAAKTIMEDEKGLPADQKTILEPLDIVNCFSLEELADLAMAVMELSEVVGGQKVTKITEDLKN